MNERLTKYIIAQLGNLNTKELLEVAQNCIELGGISTVEYYCDILGESKRTIYDRLKKNKLPYLQVNELKLPCINIKL